MARKQLTEREKQYQKRNRRKKRRDFFIRCLAIVMVFVTVIVIILPVMGPLKELFKAIGKSTGPTLEAWGIWISTTFNHFIQWVQSFF